MTAPLKIAAGLALPAELAGRRTAVFGISGSGKSNTAAVIVEQLLAAGEQVVMVDPKGEGWGLLSNADGKPSKLPVIVFGEPNGHIETLAESHGPRLADFVVETGRSVVLSLLGFESDQSERRFVSTFLRQLYRRKSRQPKPSRTLVVLDEAHLFVPENVRGDAAELAGAVQRIARQGRSFGLGTLLVDQRPQDVSKRVVTQCDTLVCHQLVHKTDRDALREWVRGYDVDGRGEQFLESLAQLQPGEAWVWSPGWLKVFQRVTVSRRKTFDSGAAPDGSSAARSVQRAEVDLDALRGQLAEVVEQAKANDPVNLKKKIADLEKQLRGRPAVEPPEPKVVEVPALTPDQERAIAAAVDEFKAAAEKVGHAISLITQAKAAVRPSPSIPAPKVVQSAPTRTAAIAPPSGDLTGPQQAILDTVLMLGERGIPATRDCVARWLGIHPNGGSYGANLGRLRSEGYLDAFHLTDRGKSSARPQPTGLEAALSALPNEPTRKIIRTVVDAGDSGLSRDELAARLGLHPHGGSYGANLGWLRTMGLLTERGPIRATDGLLR